MRQSSFAEDLFGTPELPGLAYHQQVITAAEAADLVARIDDEPLSPFRFQGWLGKRLTRSFGWSYDFDTGCFAECEPIADWLQPLRCRAAGLAGIAADRLVQALMIRYDPGAGIGWHRDRPVFDQVIGISLGAPAKLRLRRRTQTGFDRHSVPLAPRSLYHLSGEARHEWEHSLAPMQETRWSITFRSLADR
jgi:alkylated DNA repair dioxygenase AlkB